MELLAEDETASTALLTFSSARFSLDPRAATIQAIAVANGGGMADNTDEAYEHFLLIQAGLEHHPRSEEYLALARQITAKGLGYSFVPLYRMVIAK